MADLTKLDNGFFDFWLCVADEGDMVTVESVRPMGNVFEVRVVPDGYEGENWLCFLNAIYWMRKQSF